MKKMLIIGAGGWGWNHVHNTLRHPGWEVAGCVDINPKVHQRLQNEFGIPKSKLFSDYRYALDLVNTDAVTVSVPNPHRMPILKKVLRRNLNVLIDKPMVHTPADLRQLLKWKRNSKSIVMVAQNYRFDPLTRGLHARIQKGQFGILNHILVTFLRDCSTLGNPAYLKMKGNTLLVIEMCIHHFDLMRYFLNCSPLTVTAHSWRPKQAWGKGDTGLHALFEFPNDIRVTYYADWAQPFDITSWGGHWKFSFNKGVLDLEQGTNQPADWTTRKNTSNHVRKIKHPSQQKKIERSPIDSMYPTFQEFTRAIQTKTSPETSLEDNLQSIAMSFAVTQSCKSGKQIDFQRYIRKEQFV